MEAVEEEELLDQEVALTLEMVTVIATTTLSEDTVATTEETTEERTVQDTKEIGKLSIIIYNL